MADFEPGEPRFDRESWRERRRRRLEEQRRLVSLSSLFLLGLIAGLGVSLYLAWAWAPDLAQGQASPAVLWEPYKKQYIFMVAQAYAADGDWTQAQARLALLEDETLADSVVALLEEDLRRGAPAEGIRNLARLAEQIGAEGAALALFAPTAVPVDASPTPSPTIPPTSAAQPSATPTLLPSPTPSPIVTRTPTAVPQPQETPSPSPSPQLNYRLVSQEQVCQLELPAPRIEVTIVDELLQPLPGIEIRASWEGGEDTFFTGFKPEIDPGYADFEMTPDVFYAIQVVDGGPEVSGLLVEPCADGSGSQGWLLSFQRLSGG